MKKILYTSYSGVPDKNTGGGNRIIAEIMSNLKSEDYGLYYFSDYFDDITPASSIENFSFGDKILSKKIWGTKIFKSSSIFRLIVLSQLYQQYFLNRIHKRFLKMASKVSDLNIVHAHDSLSASIFHSLKRQTKILSIHSKGSFYADLEERFYSEQNVKKWIRNLQRFEINNFLNSDIVTFPSIFAKQIFYEDLNIVDNGSKDVKIIYNGIDLNLFQNIDSKIILAKFNIDQYKYDLILINVASHSKLKNIDYVLRAIFKLKNDFKFNPLLINIGTGQQTKNLLKLIREMNLLSNVKLLGNISNTNVIRLMKSSDMFFLLSEKVIFDIVILEALASGIPVVASNEGGNKEIIQNGVNGYLVNKNNLDEVVSKIIECKKRNLKNSKILLDKKFTSNNMTLQYKKLYDK